MDRIGAVLVDTYRIDRLIAEGGMGAVYEASHLRIPKKFAVKFLKLALLDNNVALMRFRREAELIATLDHPAIVSLIDYNITDDGQPYMVLEYLEGEHLGDRVSRGRLPLVDALRISATIAEALQSAHDRGVVHRDLKPENIILCQQGATKVVDFGIAKLRGGEQLTAFNSILGTITYMAPEQLTAGVIDSRADQFALAAMVYEMLSGDMPFGSEGTIPEIADRVLRKQPPPIAGYPREVFDVLLKALAKEADKRYESVREFHGALAEASRPILAAAEKNAIPSPLPDTGETDIPNEPTAMASQPTIVSGPTNLASTTQPTVDVPSEDEAPSETTRITRSPLEKPLLTAPLKTRPELITGRTSAVRVNALLTLYDRLGPRGGIVLGVSVGFVVALVVVALLR